jgi:hypothetical protein
MVTHLLFLFMSYRLYYYIFKLVWYQLINILVLQKKQRIPQNLRRRIIDRDGVYCVYCDEDLTNAEIHMDHVIPESQGGATTYHNLQVTCRKCNLAKGVLSEAEFTKRLRTRAMNILYRLGPTTDLPQSTT